MAFPSKKASKKTAPAMPTMPMAKPAKGGKMAAMTPPAFGKKKR